MTEQQELTRIEQMASLLITGEGMSDYALSKALNVFLRVVKQSKKGSERQDIINDAKQQIWSFLHQDDERRGNATKEKVDEFVDHLDALSKERYNGSLQNMYRNKNHIRSAYLWAVQAEIMRRHEEKKAKEDEQNDD